MPDDGVDDLMTQADWDTFFRLLAKFTGGLRPNSGGKWWPDQYAEVVKEQASKHRATRDVEKFVSMMS